MEIKNELVQGIAQYLSRKEEVVLFSELQRAIQTDNIKKSNPTEGIIKKEDVKKEEKKV